MPKKKLQIFISSTYLDLVEERQAAVAAILKSGHIPAGMELFTAGNESQWETITRWIDESDIYMLILGGRYGSTHKETGCGYTEMEYDYAVSKDKPFFAVVMDDKALDERVKKLGKDVLELKHPEKLQLFREKVLSKISTFFSDSKDIRLAIHETIPTLENRHTLSGWISGKEFNDTKPLIDELAKVSDENRNLKKEIDTLKKKISVSPKSDDDIFGELWDLLSQSKIDITKFKDGNKEIPDNMSLLQLFYSNRNSIATGVTNQIGIGDWESFLYFTLCPALELYELVQNEKVASVKYRRYALTPKGRKFLAYVEKHLLEKKADKTTEKKK